MLQALLANGGKIMATLNDTEKKELVQSPLDLEKVIWAIQAGKIEMGEALNDAYGRYALQVVMGKQLPSRHYLYVKYQRQLSGTLSDATGYAFPIDRTATVKVMLPALDTLEDLHASILAGKGKGKGDIVLYQALWRLNAAYAFGLMSNGKFEALAHSLTDKATQQIVKENWRKSNPEMLRQKCQPEAIAKNTVVDNAGVTVKAKVKATVPVNNK